MLNFIMILLLSLGDTETQNNILSGKINFLPPIAHILLAILICLQNTSKIVTGPLESLLTTASVLVQCIISECPVKAKCFLTTLYSLSRQFLVIGSHNQLSNEQK